MDQYNINEVYPKSYHESGANSEYTPAWDWIAKVLADSFPPHYSDWVDVGCGPGNLVQALQLRGKQVLGIEGSLEALGILSGLPILIWDLRLPIPLKGLGDVVCCFDVAEHVGAAEILVESICRLARFKILFGAAPPGQDGHGHIDLRPAEEWAELFKSRGWKLCSKRTEEIKSTLRSNEIHSKIWWVEKNLQLFTSA